MEVCLVTGGAGFLGSHLVKALLARKYSVRVLDNLSTGTLANLGRCARDVELIVGDLGDLALLREMAEGVSVVFHMAASPPDLMPFRPASNFQQCDNATAHVLIASRDCQVRRVVYASTTQVYGRSGNVPQAETDPPAPISPFAQAKLSGEQSCSAFTLHYGVESVRLRYSNVYGPRQAPSSPQARIVPESLTAMLADQRPQFVGEGLEAQDLIYIEDAVRATLLAAETKGISGRVYNVAHGRMTQAQEVVATLNELLDTRLAGESAGMPLEDEFLNAVDVSRVREELGFSPRVNLYDGLLRTVQSVSTVLETGPKWAIERFSQV